jgi:5''-methylthioadenosine/S-adenosylhomocysteine nucleosidase
MIGIIAAMKIEADAVVAGLKNVKTENIRGINFYVGEAGGKKVSVALSGVGKVSAALAAAFMIERYSPSEIYSTGVAGGLGELGRLQTIIASAVVQHDMDTTALGDAPGFISGLKIVEIGTSPILNEKLRKALPNASSGIIASGDQFIASDKKAARIRKMFGASAVDMESAAIGQAAYTAGIPFAVLRVVSDGGGDNSPVSFQEFAGAAAKISANALLSAIDS